MSGIGTVISVVDRMSGPLREINNNLGDAIKSMREVDEVSGQMFNQTIENQYIFITNTNESTKAAGGLESALKRVLSVASAIASVKFGIGAVKDLLAAADVQNRAETQLATVMSNMGYTREAFDSMRKMASEMQQTSIYGDEVFLAGAAELASYVTDEEALKQIMSVLPNFATGMTGGAELDATGMTDIATQLGKVFNGSYDGIAKKGFQLTEQQKEIIKEGTDMEKALTISDIVNEGWERLAENMANTPQGSVIQLKNAWSDVKEVIGNELYPTVNTLVTAMRGNLPQIQTLLKGVAFAVEGIIQVMTWLVNAASKVFDFLGEHIDAVEVAIASIAGVASLTFGVIYDIIVPFVNFFGNVFNDPIQAIGYLFVDLADLALNVLQTIAQGIDYVFGSNMAGTIKGWRNNMYLKAEDLLGQRQFALESTELTDALRAGVEWGVNLTGAFSGDTNTYDVSGLFDNTEEIAENTDIMAEKSSDEIIKYMRDIAERDAINRFTTAEVKVELGGVTNNVNSDVDLDAFVVRLSDRLEEELSYTAAAYNGGF